MDFDPGSIRLYKSRTNVIIYLMLKQQLLLILAKKRQAGQDVGRMNKLNV